MSTETLSFSGRVRPFTTTDTVPLYHILHKTIADGLVSRTTPITNSVVEELKNMIDSVRGHIYNVYSVAVEDQDEVIGTACLKQSRFRSTPTTSFIKPAQLIFHIDPIHQGRGVAKSLANSMEHQARGMGYTEIIILTDLSNASSCTPWRNIAELDGYSGVGIISDYFGGSRDALVWKKSLLAEISPEE